MTKPKHIIILQSEAEPQKMEPWGALTDICDAHPSFPYPTLKKKKFPFKYKGYWFLKFPFKTITLT